jgi:signal transduction histidine kinase
MKRATVLIVFSTVTATAMASLALDWVAESRGATQSTWGAGGHLAGVLFVFGMYTFAIAGTFVLWRDPENRIGWLLLVIGAVWALDGALSGYYVYGLVIRPGSLPAPRAVAAVESAMWVPAIGLMGFFLVLLFPDGRAPTARSRVLARATTVAMVLAFVAIVFAPGEIEDASVPHLENPLTIDALSQVLDPLRLTILAIPLAIVGAAVAMIGRFRRSKGVERLQLKWFAFAAAVVAANYLIAMTSSLPYTLVGNPDPAWTAWPQAIALFSFALIPIAVGIGILRYRLYDIDVVISKTVVFAGLAAFITIVYVAIVVGIGRLIGSGNGGAGLQIAATAIVALLFQPVRDWVRRFANRLVYGKRATPYEVMADLGRRMAGTLEIDHALPQLAETAAAGVGAAASRVSLFMPDGGVREALAPAGAESPAEWAAAVEVRHLGEPIGEIAVAKAPGDPLRPTERSLLDDLAAQAGLALHNVRLTDELAARAADLTATATALESSRHRIVRVRDEQRRRLEREISEGPRARLESIGLELGRLVDGTPDGPDGAPAALDRLGEETNVTLERLRELARGIFPPLLADQGIAAALEAHLRKIGVEATREFSRDVVAARFDPDVEACVYFCCLQAIQNVKRHAGEAFVHVELSTDGDALAFVVRDEGPGFDTTATPQGTGVTIMRDRVEALDGVLEIESAPGLGTTVRGRIPTPIPIAGGARR